MGDCNGKLAKSTGGNFVGSYGLGITILGKRTERIEKLNRFPVEQSFI